MPLDNPEDSLVLDAEKKAEIEELMEFFEQVESTNVRYAPL